MFIVLFLFRPETVDLEYFVALNARTQHGLKLGVTRHYNKNWIRPTIFFGKTHVEIRGKTRRYRKSLTSLSWHSKIVMFQETLLL